MILKCLINVTWLNVPNMQITCDTVVYNNDTIHIFNVIIDSSANIVGS